MRLTELKLQPRPSLYVLLVDTDAHRQQLSTLALAGAGVPAEQIYLAASQKQLYLHLEAIKMQDLVSQSAVVVTILTETARGAGQSGGGEERLRCADCAWAIHKLASLNSLPGHYFLVLAKSSVRKRPADTLYDFIFHQPMDEHLAEQVLQRCQAKFPHVEATVRQMFRTSSTLSRVPSVSSLSSMASSIVSVPSESPGCDSVAEGIDFILAHSEPLCVEAMACNLEALGMSEDQVAKASDLQGFLQAVRRSCLDSTEFEDSAAPLVVLLNRVTWARAANEEMVKMALRRRCYFICTDATRVAGCGCKDLFFGCTTLHSQSALSKSLVAVMSNHAAACTTTLDGF
eukprot:TRINITY_DN44700_c0_g2_i1.p1 TRINITY_DN44700_c0_g2~~TRINITY_DN44700_c0_g2_i1.p1  ORF type:complete len:345 (+),score=59.03 TRINITY_DN44700_c0_g2_i1:233-1267(+)